MFPRLTFVLVALAALAFVACDGDSDTDDATATPTTAVATDTPAATDATTGLGPARPERDRIVEHIRVLSQEIGTRPAGSAAEAEAVAYAREEFERYGYDVEVQEFTASDDVLREASVIADETIDAVPFRRVGPATVTGSLVDAGTGRPEEFPVDAAGAIVLIQRLDVTFSDMERNALAAGAIGVITANREPGRFQGAFGRDASLPMVGIDIDDGADLRARAAGGDLEVTITVEELAEVTASNVVARGPEPCRTLTVGHFDSVPWAAGTNDNASGSAFVLEIARAAAASELDGHCFALFGAEEVGLVGSTIFIARMSDDELDALEVVYNFDVLAGDARPLAVGSRAAIARIERVAGELGLDVELSRRTDEIASDHLPFLEAGFPAVIITVPDFQRIHTAADSFANLEPSPHIDGLAALGLALLEAS